MTTEEQIETYVKQWFCQNNEILWERGGHYKEEVEALRVLLRERERAVWEAVDERIDALLAGDDPIVTQHEAGWRLSLKMLKLWCRQQAAR